MTYVLLLPANRYGQSLRRTCDSHYLAWRLLVFTSPFTFIAALTICVRGFVLPASTFRLEFWVLLSDWFSYVFTIYTRGFVLPPRLTSRLGFSVRFIIWRCQVLQFMASGAQSVFFQHGIHNMDPPFCFAMFSNVALKIFVRLFSSAGWYPISRKLTTYLSF